MTKASLTAFLLLIQTVSPVSLIAQTTSGLLAEKIKISADGSQKFKQMDNAIFAAELAKLAPASDIAEALEAQSDYFAEGFREATKGQFEKGVEKSRELNKKRQEELKATTPKRLPRVYGKSDHSASDLFIDLAKVSAGFRPTIRDGLQVVEVETDTGVTSTASETKSIDLPEATVTRRQTGSSEIGYDGKNTMKRALGTEETVETISKTDGRKLTKTSKINFANTLEICPDQAGIIRGTGSAKFFSQMTINTGRQLAALTTDYLVEYEVTGYVGDDAEMTHFDLRSTTTEKKLGFDRALRLGFVDSTNGITDGTRTLEVQFEGNTPPSSTTDQYGRTRYVTPELGKETARPNPTNSDADNRRLVETTGYATGSFIIDLDLLMRSSISRWKNYECVNVSCTSPKAALSPNEAVDVTVFSVSTVDQSKIPAQLKGSGTQKVTPGDQKGTPTAIYNLTAPDKDKAMLIVHSISRRGIGLEVLEIPVQTPKKKPPVKTPAPKPKKCDQGWTGTVKAVRTFRKLERGNASGRLQRQVTEVVSNYSVDVSIPGTRDLAGGIVNNFHGNARVGFTKEERRERNYAPGKMSCKGSGIITSPETQKNILNHVGDSEGQILVAIAAIGNRGHIDFSPPPLAAAFTHNYIYETLCPSYDEINTKTTRSDTLVDITQTGFEVDFEIDPSTPNVLSGSKTVEESDGSETTYTWSLSRCLY